jgi:alanine racemase
VEVDLNAIRSNFRAIRRLTRQREVEQRKARGLPTKNIRTPMILPVVKADAYGHGMLTVVKELVRLETDFLGVSGFSEGVRLRRNGIKKPILVLEPPLPGSIKNIVDDNLIATICAYSTASSLNAYAKSLNKKANIHIKVDTGMGRLGVKFNDAQEFIKKVMRLSNIAVQGLYTHFPVADTRTKFTKRQIDDMSALVQELDAQGYIIPCIHGANSMGVTGYPTRVFNIVRPGLMLYGLYPAAGYEKLLSLKPAMSVKARVIFVKEMAKGLGISYGHTFITRKKMKIATLAIGYNDGFMRAFSNKADVLIGGKRCRVLGRVTMDQVVVDVTHLSKVQVGTEAVVIGKQKSEQISADELAAHANTINYEVVCSLGNRLPRFYRG